MHNDKHHYIVSTSSIASGEQSAALTAKICHTSGKRQQKKKKKEKRGKKIERIVKRGKIGKKRQKLEGSFTLRGWHFLRKGMGPKYTGGHKFLERKIGGHKIFDDQNVGSHKISDHHRYCVFFVQND